MSEVVRQVVKLFLYLLDFIYSQNICGAPTVGDCHPWMTVPIYYTISRALIVV